MAKFFTTPKLAVRAAPSAADRALKAAQQAEFVRDLWIVLASIIGFLALVRLLRLAISFIHRPKTSQDVPGSPVSEKASPEETHPGNTGKVSWRRIPAALASAFRIVAFRLSIPIGPGAAASITELSFICGYIAVMFILLFNHTRDLETFLYQDRAAHLASCQLPLIVALAGKNNIISFLTGVGHEKLNVLHRAAARTCLIFLWIHAGCRASAGLPEQFDFSHAWMRWGATGLTAFTLTTIISVRPVRNLMFEFFLISHIVLVAIFMLGGYLHAREPGFGDYIWPALVVWAFDRVLRFGRVIWNNSGRLGAAHTSATAKVELLSSDTIRLTLRRSMRWTPGQHAYVVLPTVSEIPTEAHPFTIASIPDALDGTAGGKEKDVVFLIRGRSGFTGRLRDHAAKNGICTVPAFIDGPYGCPPDLTKYSTCVLIAGGSGVSYTLPLLLNLVSKARAGKSRVRRVVFVWSVRESEHVGWISKILNEALVAAQPTSLCIEPSVYVTSGRAPLAITDLPTVAFSESTDGTTTPETPISPITEKDEKAALPIYSALRIKHGRPSVRRVLQDEISTAVGPVSVDVAGPSALSQSVARVLSSGEASPSNVLKGGPSVTLHVETFGMTK